MYVANTDLIVSADTLVQVQWSPESILPMEAPGNYEVDIELLEMNMETGFWSKTATLETGLPNNGVANVRIPSYSIQVEEDNATVESSLSPVIIQVALNASSTRTKRGVFTNFLAKLGRFALKTIKNSPMRFLYKLARQAAQRVLCEIWGALQPRNIGQEILNRLPPCPRRIRDARAPNSGFTEERFSSLVPIVGRVQNYFGTTLIDDAFRTFFHPGTANCFRQRVTDRYILLEYNTVLVLLYSML